MNLISQLERIEKHLRTKTRGEELIIVGFDPASKKLVQGKEEFKPPADFPSDKYNLMVVSRHGLIPEQEVNEALEQMGYI